MYPGANNTELCPTRFFTGEPLYRDGRAPDDGRGRAARRAPTGGRTTTRSTPSSRGCSAAHGHAMLFDGHSIQSELPWLFEGRLPDLNLGTAGGASCAPALREALAGVLAAQPRFTPRRRRPLQGRLHHAPLRPAGEGVHAVQLEMCWRCYMDESRRYAIDADARGRALQPVLRALVEATLDWTADAVTRTPLLWAPRAWIARRAGATRVLLARRRRRPLGRGRARRRRRPPGAQMLAGPVLPGLVDAHSHAFQRAFAGLAERRDSGARRLLVVARPHVRRRAAHHARAAARDRGAALRRAAARRLHPGLRVPLPAARPTTAAATPIRRRCRGRWPTRPRRPASA